MEKETHARWDTPKNIVWDAERKQWIMYLRCDYYCYQQYYYYYQQMRDDRMIAVRNQLVLGAVRNRLVLG